MKKILIVDDEESVRYSFRKLFREPDFQVIEAGNGIEALKIFPAEMPDLVVLDIEMPAMNGLDTIQKIKAISPITPVLIITAFGTTERVIKAMKYGAYDYLEKPFDIPRLKELINEALLTRSIAGEEISAGSEEDRIVGNSPAIKEVYKMIGRVAASDVNVLLTGESGTGKELIARAIHQNSNRPENPFITINCAAIPDTLLESELFGYEKGSFTDASKAKPGKFELADKGTIFLDEIGDMSLPIQAKLLRVLQEGTFEHIGGTKAIKVDVRLIAATNKNLENAIIARLFREDLYYRLKVINITLPPLRMRKEDIPLLTHYFIAKHGRQLNKSSVYVPPETIEKLLANTWPGNIRELENVLKRAIVLSKNNVISPDLIEGDFLEQDSENTVKEQAFLSSFLPDDLTEYEGRLYKHVIEEVEKELIKDVLIKSRWNQVKSAKILGISRVMLHERMEKFNLHPPDTHSSGMIALLKDM